MHSDCLVITTDRAWLAALGFDYLTQIAVCGVRHRVRHQIEGDSSGSVRIALYPYAPTFPPPPRSRQASKPKARRAHHADLFEGA